MCRTVLSCPSCPARRPGVFCILFIAGFIYPRSVVTDKNTEITELKEALEAERSRANTAVTSASATRDLLSAIQIGREIGRDVNSGQDGGQ